jgi:NTE family protein
VLRIGVVLGAGGCVGLAYHGGVLAALEEATGWDPRSAEIVVGTSAGAISAALLRAGMAAGDLRRVSEGEPLSPEGSALAGAGALHRPRPQWSRFLWPRLPADPAACARALLAPWSRPPLAWAAAVLPAGPVPTGFLSAGLDGIDGGRWPDRPLWVNAVRLSDGRAVSFGRAGAPAAGLGDAVAASCAIPAYFRPVRIGADRYVDGGVASPHHLGLLAGAGLDLVVVSAPMAHAGERGLTGTAGALRALVRRQLDREAARVRHGGTDVVVLAPTRRVAGAMGRDALDARRRRLVSRMARTSTLAYLERSGFAPVLAGAARRSARRSPAAWARPAVSSRIGRSFPSELLLST